MLRKPSKGGSSIFNTVNIGLLIGHGIRGSSQDFLATSTPSLQTYFPIYHTGVNSYDWVRMSEFSFGSQNGLRWMAIYACNMLYPDNAQDMYNKGLLPMTSSLHSLLASETSIHMYPTFGHLWANGMNGGETGSPLSVIAAWNRAGQKVHAVVKPGHNVVMTVAYWPACQNDTLLSYSESGSSNPSDIQFSRVEVYTP